MEPPFFLELLKSITAPARAFEFPFIDPKQNIGEFVVQIYNISLGLVGLAVFIQFLRAGLTYLFAAGNMAEVGKARTMMTNAVLGAILLMSSYLILNLINPDLTKPNFLLPSLPAVPKTSIVVNPSPKTETMDPADARIVLGNAGITTGSINLNGVTEYGVNGLTGIARTCACGRAMTITEFLSTPSINTFYLSLSSVKAEKDLIDAFREENVGRIEKGSGATGSTGLSPGTVYGNSFGATYTYLGDLKWSFRFPNERI